MMKPIIVIPLLVSSFSANLACAVPTVRRIAQSPPDPTPAGDHLSTRIDQSESSAVPIVIAEDGSTYTQTITVQEGASYTAVHFVDFDMGNHCKMVVTGKDLPSGVEQRYEMVGTGKMQLGTFWAKHVKGDTVQIQIECPPGLMAKDETTYVIDKMSVGFPELPVYVQEGNHTLSETLCASEDWANAVCYAGDSSYDKGRAVARLLIHQGTQSHYCTGWLLSNSSHLITNRHCLSSQHHASNTDFDFDAENLVCFGLNSKGCCGGTVYSGSTYIQDSQTLDYALLQLNEDAASEFGYLEIDDAIPYAGQQIYIVQHPYGAAKRISWDSGSDTGGVCRVQGYPVTNKCRQGTGLEYQCDTASGSSGSPVLSATSDKVVALHNCGGCPNGGLAAHAIWAEISGIILANAPGIPSSSECSIGFGQHVTNAVQRFMGRIEAFFAG